MRPNRYFTIALFVGAFSLLLALPASAQYGSGVVVDVPMASAPITIDGSDDDPDWDLAATIDLVQNWEAGWVGGFGDAENPEAIANARLLWREGVLYMYIYVEQENHDLFFTAGNPWQTSHLLVGVDLTGEDDEAYDANWEGWPGNAPNEGAVAYKINPESGVTLNWGFNDAPDPVEEEWVEAAMIVNEDNRSWVLELAIHGEEITGAAQIGFNIAGAIASNPPGHEWGWFLYSKCDPAPPDQPGMQTRCAWAGGVQSDARGFASLNLVEPELGFLQVPRTTATFVLDGVADEAAWANAAEVDLTANWNSGYYAGWGDPEVPDVISTAKLLWDEGVLYLFIHSEHGVPMLFMPPAQGDDDPSPWNANQILVGIDLTNNPEYGNDNSWSGWPWNAPDHGPVTYRINPEFGGITLNWGQDITWLDPPWIAVDPIEEGYVDGTIVVNEEEQWWSIEMAIFGDQISSYNQARFNIGGAASDEEMCPPIGTIGECTYAWYSWQAISKSSAGGDVVRVNATFAPIEFYPWAVSDEGGPSTAGTFSLDANFPNPFSLSTTLVYNMEREGTVELGLYDVLGRRLVSVDSGLRGAGEHRVALDGSGLASGLYVARLMVDGAMVATRTLMRVE
jgi:hypothetical protein